jgi:hypothetical protein
VRSAVDAVSNAQDDQRQFKEQSCHEDADEESDNSADEINQSLGGRLLHAEDDTGDDGDTAREDGDNVQQFYETAKQRMMEREIEESSKKILFIGHAASWAHKSIVEAVALRVVRLFRDGSQGK